MADRSIAELNEATELFDDGLTVVYQGNETKKIAGAALKDYARKSVLGYAEEAAAIATADAEAAATAAEEAKTAAQEAEAAAVIDAQSAKTASAAAASAQSGAESAKKAAETAKSGAEIAKTGAETAKSGAENARDAIQNMTVEAQTLQPSQDASVNKQVLSDGSVKLIFGVPQGKQGNKGDTGDTGIITDISRTSGIGAPGTVDTYTITTNYEEKYTFQVYNGANGTGTGDMVQSTYDPTNKAQDIFSYADNAASNAQTNAELAAATEAKKIYTQDLALNTTQQQQARQNIGAGTSNFSGSFSDLSGKPNFVNSFNQRTGNVTPQSGDYTAEQVGADPTGTAAGLLNRTTAVNTADTNYTTVMARGFMLMNSTSAEAVTNWAQYLHNGEICLFYEK